MRVIFAGGGTGGHLFPGIALAEELLECAPQADVLFLCTTRPFDREMLTQSGFPFAPLASTSFRVIRRNPLALVRTALEVRKALHQLRKFRPHLIVNLGGYGTIPVLCAAIKTRTPYVLLEQNYLPGKSNRLALSGAARLYSQWEGAAHFLKNNQHKVIVTGSPLRKNMKKIDGRSAKKRLQLDADKFTLTILGGSQGAHSLNRLVLRELKLLESLSKELQIVHTSGRADKTFVEQEYRKSRIGAKTIDFTSDMATVYSATDGIVSRAGGLAIAEIAHFGIPAILVPYPYAAEQHQSLNAREVEKAGAGFALDEERWKEGDLYAHVKTFMTKPDVVQGLRSRSATLARPNAAQDILKDISLLRENYGD